MAVNHVLEGSQHPVIVRRGDPGQQVEQVGICPDQDPCPSGVDSAVDRFCRLRRSGPRHRFEVGGELFARAVESERIVVHAAIADDVRPDPTGVDGRGTLYTGTRQLVPERLGVSAHGELGSAVRTLAGNSGRPGNTGSVDHRAVTLAKQQQQGEGVRLR